MESGNVVLITAQGIFWTTISLMTIYVDWLVSSIEKNLFFCFPFWKKFKIFFKDCNRLLFLFGKQKNPVLSFFVLHHAISLFSELH